MTPTDDAPAWAVRRLDALRSANSYQKLRESINASFTCLEVANAFKYVSGNPGGQRVSDLMADALPKAVVKCECRDVDVDALELFVSYVLGDGYSKISDGWLAFRADASSANEIRAASAVELGKGLGALSREQRTAGVKLSLAAGPNRVAARLAERCKSEH